MVPHLEPDILEYEVKWALGSITTNKGSRSNAIPAELFKILKDDAFKVLYSICHNFGNLSSGHRTRKSQLSFQSQSRVMSRNVQTTVQFYSFHASKVMVKILQARFQQYVNHEIPDVLMGF